MTYLESNLGLGLIPATCSVVGLSLISLREITQSVQSHLIGSIFFSIQYKVIMLFMVVTEDRKVAMWQRNPFFKVKSLTNQASRSVQTKPWYSINCGQSKIFLNELRTFLELLNQIVVSVT